MSKEPYEISSRGLSFDLNGAARLGVNAKTASIGISHGRMPIWFEANPIGIGRGGNGADILLGAGPIFVRSGTDGSGAIGVTALGLVDAEAGQTAEGIDYSRISVLGQPLDMNLYISVGSGEMVMPGGPGIASQRTVEVKKTADFDVDWVRDGTETVNVPMAQQGLGGDRSGSNPEITPEPEARPTETDPIGFSRGQDSLRIR